jgi:DNA-binding CsgD family transcriptional regulator
MAAEWCGPEQAESLARMREDHPNLVAALDWSVSHPGQERTAAALAAALRYHWVVGGFLGEGRRWLDQVLDELAPGEDGRAERGTALWVASWVSLVQGDWATAEARLAECSRLASALDDAALAAHAAHWSGLAALFRGHHADAVALFEKAIAGHRATGETTGELIAAFQFAVSLAYYGELGRARETCETATRLADACGERWSRAYDQWATGIVSWLEGNFGAARRLAQEALAVQSEFRDGICTALGIELLAWIAATQAEPARAAELFGAARAVWTEIGTAMHSFGPAMEGDSLRATKAAEAKLGRRRFAELVDQYRPRDMAGAIATALDGDGSPSSPERPSSAAGSPLSRRETEVARLVAQGMSNRGIAEALVVSPRTVDGHVERILAKLGFTSRTQVAAWSAEHL